jgi:hypothetical protein
VSSTVASWTYTTLTAPFAPPTGWGFSRTVTSTTAPLQAALDEDQNEFGLNKSTQGGANFLGGYGGYLGGGASNTIFLDLFFTFPSQALTGLSLQISTNGTATSARTIGLFFDGEITPSVTDTYVFGLPTTKNITFAARTCTSLRVRITVTQATAGLSLRAFSITGTSTIQGDPFYTIPSVGSPLPYTGGQGFTIDATTIVAPQPYNPNNEYTFVYTPSTDGTLSFWIRYLSYTGVSRSPYFVSVTPKEFI